MAQDDSDSTTITCVGNSSPHSWMVRSAVPRIVNGFSCTPTKLLCVGLRVFVGFSEKFRSRQSTSPLVLLCQYWLGIPPAIVWLLMFQQRADRQSVDGILILVINDPLFCLFDCSFLLLLLLLSHISLTLGSPAYCYKSWPFLCWKLSACITII